MHGIVNWLMHMVLKQDKDLFQLAIGTGTSMHEFHPSTTMEDNVDYNCFMKDY